MQDCYIISLFGVTEWIDNTSFRFVLIYCAPEFFLSDVYSGIIESFRPPWHHRFSLIGPAESDHFSTSISGYLTHNCKDCKIICTYSNGINLFNPIKICLIFWLLVFWPIRRVDSVLPLCDIWSVHLKWRLSFFIQWEIYFSFGSRLMSNKSINFIACILD